MSWTCPHCQRPQVLTNQNRSSEDHIIQIGYLSDWKAFRSTAIACLNEECRKMTLLGSLYPRTGGSHPTILGGPERTWRLIPDSAAKPQPSYIPPAIVQDYEEACRVRDLSPKASATLARRCLQGMIRDFCGISKPTLFKEIAELRNQIDSGSAPKGVTHESVDAIDAVRSVGNIGAHMEKDVGLIVDIEPGEAQMLIDLLEMLLDEWYVERDKRTRRLAQIMALSAQKAKEINDAHLQASQPSAARGVLPIDDEGS